MGMEANEAAKAAKPEECNFLRLWDGLAQRTFPFMEDEVGELSAKARLFVTVCEAVVKPETFGYAKWKGVGRPHRPGWTCILTTPTTMCGRFRLADADG